MYTFNFFLPAKQFVLDFFFFKVKKKRSHLLELEELQRDWSVLVSFDLRIEGFLVGLIQSQKKKL